MLSDIMGGINRRSHSAFLLPSRVHMSQRLGQIVACLQLARIGLVLTAVSNIWLVAFLSRALPDGHRAAGVSHAMPLGQYLLVTAAVAVGMYIFGMVLNDVMDLRRDRLFAPHKPLPARQFRPAAATGLAIGALLMAIAASLPLGNRSTILCLATAALVLFYNGPAKRISGLGVLTLGFIRAGHMLIANPDLPYVWPVWLTMTHVIGLSALCHRLEDKRPTLSGGHVWLVTLGWAFVSLIMIEWISRDAVELDGLAWAWIGPTVLALLFVVYAVIICRKRHPSQSAGMTLMKHGLVWLIAYDAAWLLGAGLWKQSIVIIVMLPASWLFMAAIRALKLLAQPMPRFNYKLRQVGTGPVDPSLPDQ